MRKATILAFLLLTWAGSHQSAIAAATSAAAATNSHVINTRSATVDRVRMGMYVSELPQTAYRLSRGKTMQEGDIYNTVMFWPGDHFSIHCILDDDDRLAVCTTTSLRVKDERGIGVGSTLKQLKAAYPEGNAIVGDEHRRYANFITGTPVMYALDQSAIADICFDDPTAACELDEGAVKVERIVMHAERGAAASRLDLSLDSCKPGSHCVVVGRLTLHPGAPAGAALVSKGDDCVKLALPDAFYSDVAQGRWNNQLVSVDGVGFLQPDTRMEDEVLMWYSFKDRRLSTGMCDDGPGIYVERMRSHAGHAWPTR
ncbi:hypothetical protein [Stenotrophomonas sp. PS02289]|uniref:hypothetical protein n=1 Tax=Stenotrophomonas sp. PS02289 TaxID=2991422 RepID=UPI00249B42DA|nr:hypothetical protein [Stenotrophomonas sp. PS02289]